MSHRPAEPATVAECLRVQGDLDARELDQLLEHWGKLDQRLRSFRSGAIELLLWIKERDRPGQHVTLEAVIAGRTPLVATSTSRSLDHALNEVRDEMIRQLRDQLQRQEPRHNRHLRHDARH